MPIGGKGTHCVLSGHTGLAKGKIFDNIDELEIGDIFYISSLGNTLGYKVVNPDAVVDYMSIPTQYKVNMNARPDLKNQFTDYFYGYTDASGKYWYPEQVMQTVVNGAVKFYVRGTTTEVTPIKMNKLVKPINGGRVMNDGQKAVVVGDLPTTQYALKSNHEVRFLANQIVKHTDGKFYINGLAGTASAEVVALPVTFTKNVPTADGTTTENVTAVVTDNDFNKTGDPRID